jgi:hypothetical protein
MQVSALSVPAIAATLDKNGDVLCTYLFVVYRTRPRLFGECLHVLHQSSIGTLRPDAQIPQRARRLSGWGGECHDHVEHPLL